MVNSIEYVQKYTSILDRAYQRASVFGYLTSGRRMVRVGRNAKFYPAIYYSQLWGSSVPNRRWPPSEWL